MKSPRDLVLVFAAVSLTNAVAATGSEAQAPAYIGSEACAECHADTASAWAGSHHAWAWNQPSEATVLGDFDDAVVRRKGVITRFFRRDGRYVVETDGPDGRLTEYQVHSTAGVEPLQQILLETAPGRLQALDLAWDSGRQRWYDLYPDQVLNGGDGLHWTGPYKTWNARCAECHATGYRKNYDPPTRRYASTQAEKGVGCEACHGPGEAHAGWARGADPARWSGLTLEGFTIGFSGASAATEIQQCAGCHARRDPFGDGNPLPGTPFHDAYRLALLRDGLYHADGAIEDEVYVYGSFLQSRMYARGVRCSDCHDPHTARLKAEDNALCTHCHSPAGNSRYPSLRKAVYDGPSHHFHAPGSDGAMCKSCHMSERVYMVIDVRHDHGFRIPRPDLSAKTGTPNVCTDCHADRPAVWAAEAIAGWFPDSARRGSHFSPAFAAARKHPEALTKNLLAIAGDDDLPGIVRATALDLIGRRDEASVRSRVGTLVRDEDPLVRAAAIGVLDGASDPDTVQQILPALEDQYMAVRIAAARAAGGFRRVARVAVGQGRFSRDPHGDRRDGPGPARSACRRTRVSRGHSPRPAARRCLDHGDPHSRRGGRPRRRLRRDH